MKKSCLAIHDVCPRFGNVFSELKSRTVATSLYYWDDVGVSLRPTDPYTGLNEGLHGRIGLALERGRDGTTDNWHNMCFILEAVRIIGKQTPRSLPSPNSIYIKFEFYCKNESDMCFGIEMQAVFQKINNCIIYDNDITSHV